MGQVCNSRGHVCHRIFAHFGLAKDYGNAATAPQQQAAAVSSHEVSADLPNAKMQQWLPMCHKQILRSHKPQMQLHL